MTRTKDRKTNLGALPLPLFLSLILFQPLSGAFAQNTLIKAGINISSIAGIEEQGSLTGYHVGVGGVKELSSRLGINHELIFSQQGTRINDDNKLIYYFLNAPILLNMQPGKRFSFNVGPQVGMVLKVVAKGERKTDLTAVTSAIDISACLGIGYRITDRFFAETRFNVGLTDLARTDEPRMYTNAVFQGSVGYYFKAKTQQSE